MKLSLDPMRSAASYVYNNPGKSAIKAGQTIVALAVAYVAYGEVRAVHGVPCSCVCSCLPTNNLVDTGTRLVAALGLMLASVVIARHNFFNTVKPLPKIPGASER